MSGGLQSSKAFGKLRGLGFGSSKGGDCLNDSFNPTKPDEDRNFAKSMKRKEVAGGERGHTRSPQRHSFSESRQHAPASLREPTASKAPLYAGSNTAAPPRSLMKPLSFDKDYMKSIAPAGSSVPPSGEHAAKRKSVASQPTAQAADVRSDHPAKRGKATSAAPPRISTVHDIDPGPVTVRATRVMLGMYDCGAVEVAFTEKDIWFIPSKSMPDCGGYPVISLKLPALSRFEVDRHRGSICLWGIFNLAFAGELLNQKYQPYVDAAEPESSVWIQYDANDYRHLDQAPAWPSGIVRCTPAAERTRGTSAIPLRPVLSYPGPHRPVYAHSSQVTLNQKYKELFRMVTAHPGRTTRAAGEKAQPPGLSKGSKQLAASSRAPGAPSAQNRRPAEDGLRKRLDAPRQAPRLPPRSDSPSTSPFVPSTRPPSKRNQPREDRTKVVLVYPNEESKDAVTLTKEELHRLDTDEFLNDSLIDYQLKYIQDVRSPSRLLLGRTLML